MPVEGGCHHIATGPGVALSGVSIHIGWKILKAGASPDTPYTIDWRHALHREIATPAILLALMLLGTGAHRCCSGCLCNALPCTSTIALQILRAGDPAASRAGHGASRLEQAGPGELRGGGACLR